MEVVNVFGDKRENEIPESLTAGCAGCRDANLLPLGVLN